LAREWGLTGGQAERQRENTCLPSLGDWHQHEPRLFAKIWGGSGEHPLSFVQCLRKRLPAPVHVDIGTYCLGQVSTPLAPASLVERVVGIVEHRRLKEDLLGLLTASPKTVAQLGPTA
jgi:hypothetical protein